MLTSALRLRQAEDETWRDFAIAFYDGLSEPQKKMVEKMFWNNELEPSNHEELEEFEDGTQMETDLQETGIESFETETTDTDFEFIDKFFELLEGVI